MAVLVEVMEAASGQSLEELMANSTGGTPDSVPDPAVARSGVGRTCTHPCARRVRRVGRLLGWRGGSRLTRVRGPVEEEEGPATPTPARDESEVDESEVTVTETETGTGTVDDPEGAPAAPRWRLRHNGSLDGVRAIAVVLVIGVHSWGSELPGGGIGVAVFFTLSGFLITALLLGEITERGRLSFTNFYMRRVLRLVPALVAFVAVVYLYSRFSGVEEDRIGQSAPAALFYYANWARVAGAKLGMLGHTWSLAVEEQFYLIWPVILWLSYRYARVWGVLAASVVGALASTAARLVIQSDPNPSSARLQNGFDTQSLSIFVGCALAAVLVLGWKPRRWFVAPVALVTIWYVSTIVTSIFRAGEASQGVMPLIVAIGFASVICWLDQWPRSIPARVLALAPFAYVGRISYGLYLWHFPIKTMVGEAGYKNSAMTMAIVTALSLVVATASFFVIERPFLRLKDRFRSAPSPSVDERLATTG